MTTNTTATEEELLKLTKLISTHALDINTMLEKTKSEYIIQRRDTKNINDKMPKNSSNMDSKITLNIGGALFCTTLGTITSETRSFFSAMFSDQFNTQPDRDGQYFIDRNPTLFPYIISYLRNPTMEPNLKKLERDDLMREFVDEIEFYQINGLREIIKQGGMMLNLV
jgi:hypothetical protein